MLTEVTVETLAQIVKSVFATMMELEVSVSESPWIPDGDRLTSFVLMTGEWTGAVLIECSRWQACQFAGRILAMDPPCEVDDDVRDVLGELANMIGGNLKCAMPAGVHLSMPSVMEGNDYGLRICGLKVKERLAFECADGHFWVSVLSNEGKVAPTWDGEERRKSPDASGRNEEQIKCDGEADHHSAAADVRTRVGIHLLDKLTDLVGELDVTQDQIRDFSSEQDDADLKEKSHRLNLISAELQDSIAQMRMQPIGAVWDRFVPIVRERSISLGNGVQLVTHGGEMELDRNILEALREPLTHLVHFSCNHGIELPKLRINGGKLAQGFLTLRACYEGDKTQRGRGTTFKITAPRRIA